MNPAEFAIKWRLISVLVMLVALIGGWLAYQNMPRLEDPEFTIRTAQVITPYPGASPTEVANEVTDALETAIQQLQEIEEIKSTSSAGLSRINVDIKYEFSPTKEDLQIIWGKLRNKVADTQSSLPPGAQRSIVNDDFGDVYGLYYLLTGEGFSYKELYQYAKTLRTELLSVDGVAKVQISGEQPEAIYLEVSQAQAAALGVSIEQVFNDLAQQNSVVPAGDVRLGDHRLTINPSGSIDSVEAIGNVIVSTAARDTIVFLRDIATVRRDYQDPPKSLVRYNGQPALAIGISSVTGTNVVKVGNATDAKLAESESRRPVGMEIHEFYHQGKVVDAAVRDFVGNVILALILVLITLFVFMGLRSALVIGTVLILTVSATLATMYFADIPMHRISLGALIIALGMLVDNAIVVTEGILVGTQQGRNKLDIAKEIVDRTKWPLLCGTLVGIIAFAPIGLSPGVTAEFAGDLFWVVLISLLYSWVFGITLAPLLAHQLFEDLSDTVETKPEGQFIRLYKAFMRTVINARWVVIGVASGLLAFSLWGYQFVNDGFFPASTTPQLVIDYRLPEGTDISRTDADMKEIERVLGQLEGVKEVNTLVGEGTVRYMLIYGPKPSSTSYGQFILKLDDYRLAGTLIPQIQTYLEENFPNAQAKVWQFQLGPGGGPKIEATFSGPDPAVLRKLASEAKAIMAADGGAISITDDWGQQSSAIRPIYSEALGRRLGVSREDLANALLTNFSGRTVGFYREGEKLIPIIARSPAEERRNTDSIGSIQIVSATTKRAVPLLDTVHRFETVWRDSKLLRVNRVWTINAQTDPVSGLLPSELFARIKPLIEAIELPAGYTLEWGGEHGDSAEANTNLVSTLPAGLLAMIIVVVVLFNAVRQPLIIWLVVPLALIGVVLGLVLTGLPLEFMAILGLLSLSGLLIKNSIVLVNQMDLEINEGRSKYQAVIDAAASRVRPVTMGALTTVFGVLPLLGDAFFKSMAVVLIFGLSFATVLTLVVVPALYAVFFNVRSPTAEASQ